MAQRNPTHERAPHLGGFHLTLLGGPRRPSKAVDAGGLAKPLASCRDASRGPLWVSRRLFTASPGCRCSSRIKNPLFRVVFCWRCSPNPERPEHSLSQSSVGRHRAQSLLPGCSPTLPLVEPPSPRPRNGCNPSIRAFGAQVASNSDVLICTPATRAARG